MAVASLTDPSPAQAASAASSPSPSPTAPPPTLTSTLYPHTSTLYPPTYDANGDIIGYYDPDYNPNLLRYFAIKTEYYFRDSDGTFSRFKGKGALIRKFPDRKREIRRAILENPVNLPGASFDAYCEVVLNLADR